jgi:hypothetical protein
LEVNLFDDLIKTDHFNYSINEKGTDLNFIKQKYVEFDRINLVIKRKHVKSRKMNYDFYYLLENKCYIIYSIVLSREIPVLINAYYVQRNFEEYKKWVVMVHRDKIINQ